jgi:precorrin-6B methylase 2
MTPRRSVLIAALALAAPAPLLAQSTFSLFVPTREEIATRMIELAQLKKGDVVTDLGAGDGRLVIWSAKGNAGVTGFGVDINPQLVREASARAWMEGVGDRVKFLHQNVFDADIAKVDVIYIWLFPELMRLLRNKLLAEAKPGTRIVSQMFDFGPWQADAVDREQSSVRMWVVPARIAGNWNWDLQVKGAKRVRYAAVMEQVFQRGDAVVRVENARRAVREIRIDGPKISFLVTLPLPGLGDPKEHEFIGTVKGDVIEGKARIFGPFKAEADERVVDEYPWRAVRSAKTSYFDHTGTGPIR